MISSLSSFVFLILADDEDYIEGQTSGYWSRETTRGDTGGFPGIFFQSHRWGRNEFHYKIPVDAAAGGAYVARLGFSEVYKPCCEVGKRIIDIFVNVEPFATDLDVFQEAGGCDTALVLEKEVELAAGNQIIDFRFTSSRQNPMVSIIEIEEKTSAELTCPCFDEAVLESVEEIDTMSGWSGQLYMVSSGSLEFNAQTCPEESSSKEIQYCYSLIAASSHKFQDFYPDHEIADECPCWTEGPSSVLPDDPPSTVNFYNNASRGKLASVYFGSSIILDVGDGGMHCQVFDRINIQDGVTFTGLSKPQMNRCARDVLSFATD